MQIEVTKRNNKREQIDVDKINKSAQRACEGLTDVSASEIVLDAAIQLHDKIRTADIDKALILSTRSKIEKEPNYSLVAARLLLNCIYKEVFNKSVTQKNLEKVYQTSFIQNIKILAEDGRLNSELLKVFDLDFLSHHLKIERDKKFEYIGIQTLADRYFLRHNDKLMETPQAFFMRVAMGMSLKEKKPEEWAIKFYNELSQFNYMVSTPTLFNSATKHSQLSSCYLSQIGDSEDGIMGTIHDQARLSKYAGGLGVDATPIRGSGAKIKGTDGRSSGPIPFLKILNDTVMAFDQGGKRNGSCAVYMEPWHIDYEAFLDLRKNTGDDRLRCHDLHTASWIPDLFMQKVEANEDWYMFCPGECPELHESYGEKFNQNYYQCIELAKVNKIRHKIINAKELMRKILKTVFETGHPWFTFKDAANRAYMQKDYIVHDLNLCVEIARHNTCSSYSRGQKTEIGEVAVCLAKGTKVLTKNGYINIEECNGQDVYSPFDDSNIKFESHKYEKATLIDNGIRDVFEVVTSNGQTIKATDNHKFLVVKSKIKPRKNRIVPLAKYEWKELKDLKVGDRISTVINSSILEYKSIDNEFLCAGWLLGDGWQVESAYGVCFGGTEIFARDVVIKQIENWFSNLNSKNWKYPRFEARKDKNGVFCWASSNGEWKSFLQNKFGFETHTSHFKFLSKQIFSATPNQQASFLSGLFSADGCVTDNHISYTSASKQLLKDIQLILRNFGIVSRITDSYPRKRYQGILRIHGFSNNKLFRESIGFKLCPDKEIKLNEMHDTNVNKSSSWIHTEIKSVEYIGKEQVYDLQLNNQHTFIANTMTVHNCNLASINVKEHICYGEDKPWFDWVKLAKTVQTAVRGLDNVIDNNFYPIPEAEKSNMSHRPIGLGLMGFSDLLHRLKIPYDSEGAVTLAEDIQQFIYYYALKTSCELAQEKGKFPTFDNSEWAKGIMHHNLFSAQLPNESRQFLITEESLNKLSQDIRKYGLRNANVMAIAPTATISYIVGCSQSIEPDFSCLYVYTTLSGQLTMFNKWFVDRMKELNLWNEAFIQELKRNDGDVSKLDIPHDIKEEFKTAFDIDYRYLVDCASVRQKWIDMGQSFNLYIDVPSLKKLYDMYMYSWKKGLKSTYYLRARGASKVEKTTVDGNILQKECSIEAAKRGEVCESCS